MLIRTFRLLKISFAIIFLAATGFAAERVQCGSLTSHIMPRSFGYCALLPPSYDAQPTKRFPVLYFLHGLGGDQTFLVSTGGWSMIENAWEQKRFREFVLITPDADTSFYINSKSGRVKYESFFIREFIPAMENKFRLQGTRSGRAISGISMGGYGALRFAFKYPQMFSSVAAHMPALLEELPHGSSGTGLGMLLGNAFGSPLNERFWKENTPFVFARTSNLAVL